MFLSGRFDGIQHVSAPVTDEARRQGRKRQNDSRDNGDPPCRDKICAAIADHGSQAGIGRLHAKAKKTERGFEQHRLRKVDGKRNQQSAGDVGQDVPDINAK